MTFICLGQAPVAGCGRILTEEERYYYGSACEDCTRKWGEAIEAWRRGESAQSLTRYTARRRQLGNEQEQLR